MKEEFYWRKALKVSTEAQQASVLMPIETHLNYFPVNIDVSFEYRCITSTNFKFSNIYGPKVNPFLPWDNLLEIETINNSHVLILNKYPVKSGHMLLITKNWQPQKGWLDISDWEAFKAVDTDTSGLWFYNSCQESGASQPHRHIQLLRRTEDESICPLNSFYDKNNVFPSTKLNKYIYTIKRKNNNESARDMLTNYFILCDKLSIGNPQQNQIPKYPYNLLITPNWMSIIRRKSEYSNGFSLNALAFAGYILATDKSDKKWLYQNGVFKLLENVVG